MCLIKDYTLILNFIYIIIFISLVHYILSKYYKNNHQSKLINDFIQHELIINSDESWVKEYIPSSTLLKPISYNNYQPKPQFNSIKPPSSLTDVFSSGTSQKFKHVGFSKGCSVYNENRTSASVMPKRTEPIKSNIGLASSSATQNFQSQFCNQTEASAFSLDKSFTPGQIGFNNLSILNPEDFDFIKLLGKGSQGDVWLARHIVNKKEFAVKIINDILSPGGLSNIEREILIHSQLSHPNVLALIGTFGPEDNKALVLECAQNGSLTNYFSSFKPFSEGEAAVIIYQLVLAVEYLHSKDIVHRDIKPSNLFVDERFNVKLGDFGSATKVVSLLKDFHGTLDYISPEMIKQLPYGKKVDIWSIGIVTYELLTGTSPYENPQKTESWVCAQIISVIPKFPSHLSIEARDFMSKTIVLEPEKRASASELVHHPWFHGIA